MQKDKDFITEWEKMYEEKLRQGIGDKSSILFGKEDDDYTA